MHPFGQVSYCHHFVYIVFCIRGRRGHDRMVVGFITAVMAYDHKGCESKSRSWRGVLDTTLCDKVCQ
jgi:hypothetical protein